MLNLIKNGTGEEKARMGGGIRIKEIEKYPINIPVLYYIQTSQTTHSFK